MNFTDLHKNETPLIICNVWDVSSAKAAKAAGFKAIGTSSGAIASSLGYQDREEISFEELQYIVERITKSVDLPLSVDLEAGYSRNPDQIALHIEKLAQAGVVGVNVEDSLLGEKRQLVEASDFAETIKKLSNALNEKGLSTFLNIRTDPFLLGHPHALDETIKRARLYEAAGAHGLFVPCITQEADIKALIAATSLPVNVMCMPDLADFASLQSWGVSRISMGNFVFNTAEAFLQNLLSNIHEQASFAPIFK